MKPTMKLRFVKKAVKIDEHAAQYTTVLQQWWQEIDVLEAFGIGGPAPISENGEWRDVPVEIES